MNELPTVLGIVPIIPIAILCYFLGATLKGLGKEILDKFIPIIVGLFGGVIAIIVFYTIPNYLTATNWLDAFGIGAISGAVAVYINQVYKQLKKNSEEYFEDVAEDEEPVEGELDKEA